ncbi:replication protein P [Parashewanella curva]|uniref:Replication protein P n=1 Tax=Parashewanella curva TaxID=2338552 RepID=A0A3L8Q099_9GAMM|nr:replication protein P [Parashewanella curva]RLV60985.1 replication protein P [Parashewanella curva]
MMNGINKTQSLQELMASKAVVGSEPNAKAPSSVSEMDKSIVDSIFDKLTVLFPVGRPKDEALATHKAEWLKTLAAQGVSSIEQIKLGLQRARMDKGDRQFWPSPLQFAKWCKLSLVEAAGLPSDDEAYQEALKNYYRSEKHTWSHQLVLLAVRETGGWLFSRGKEHEVRQVFSRNYSMLVKRFINGEQFDVELPKALPSKVSVPTPKKKALSKISDIRKQLNLGARA